MPLESGAFLVWRVKEVDKVKEVEIV